MKRCRRIIFNGMTVVSLLSALLVLIATTTVLWVGSYPLQRIGQLGDFEWVAYRGWFIVDHATLAQRVAWALRQRVPPMSSMNLTWRPERSVAWMHAKPPLTWTPAGQSIQIHFGLMLAIELVLPASWVSVRVWRHRLSDQKEFGLCKNCGYDLRATPDRCPECETVAETVKV